METVMMQLGPFQFGLSTAAYQELARSTEWRWPAQERFGQLAALQYTGPGSDSLNVNGIIFPEFRGGIFQIENMRATADMGEPLLLMDGMGAVMGLWVIEKIDEKGSIFAEQGVARRQEFSMQIRKFGELEDLLEEASEGLGDAIGGAVGAVTGGISGAIAGALPSGMAGGLAGLAGQVQSAAAGAMASLSNAQGMLGSLGGIVPGGIGQLSGAVNSAISSAKNMALGGLSLGSITSLAGASSAVSGLVSQASSLANAGGRLGSLASSLQGSIPGLSGGSLASMLAVRASGGKAASKAISVYQTGSNLIRNFGL